MILTGKTLVLLAHPDDELFIISLMLQIPRGEVYFFTNFSRAKESYSFFSSRFPQLRQVLDSKFEFDDGKIHLSLDESRFRNIVELVASQEFDQIVAPQIENSHKDHDAVSIIAQEISLLLQVPIYLVPLYHFSKGRRWIASVRLFNYFRGSTSLRTDSSNRLTLCAILFRGMISYRREFRVWLHLGPAMIISYLVRPFEVLNVKSATIWSNGQRWQYFSPESGEVIQNLRIRIQSWR